MVSSFIFCLLLSLLLLLLLLRLLFLLLRRLLSLLIFRLDQKRLHPLVVIVEDAVNEIQLDWVNGWVDEQEPRMAPDSLRQEQLGITSLLLESRCGDQAVPRPGQVRRSDVDWVELAAQREDARMLDDTNCEFLPLFDRAIVCLSVCRRECALEEALHELQR